jgi:hypothetical protein
MLQNPLNDEDFVSLLSRLKNERPAYSAGLMRSGKDTLLKQFDTYRYPRKLKLERVSWRKGVIPTYTANL